MRPRQSQYLYIFLLLVAGYIAGMVMVWQQNLAWAEQTLVHVNGLFSRRIVGTLTEQETLFRGLASP